MTTANPSADDASRADRARGWLAENAEALESSNRYVDQHGLPLQPLWAGWPLLQAEGSGSNYSAISDFAG